jgi:putative nucleotidyltransferase with HDIG domain
VKLLSRLWGLNGGLLVLLGIVGVTGVLNFLVPDQRAFLNLYYLPVVLGAYLLGRRQGVLSALLACLIVFGLATTNESAFVATAGVPWTRWLDLGTWGCFLLLTSYVVGSLYDVKETQLRELQDAYHGIIEIMSKLIDSVDRYTEHHSGRVGELAMRIARDLGLSEAEVEDIRVGAILHDIGKVDVSIDVLRKAAGLSAEEYAEMQTHVDKGALLVRSVGGILRHVVPMIAYHHERWDGTGYKGLAGEAIPLGARVIAVADTYDAIVNDRSYRRGRTHAQALVIIREESGRQFDPRVVEVFLAAFDAGQDDEERLAA